MTRYVLMTMLLALPLAAAPAERPLSFTKLWTHGHTTPGQVSEIPAFDHRTNTIWVAGVVGVDVLDGETGTLIKHIDVTAYGLVNSVAIHNGLAALAIEAGPPDRRRPGVVVFYDTRTRLPIGDPVTVGSLPDMLTFTHDGSKLLVANEGTPNAVADAAYTAPDPPGSVSIIDVETRTVIATAGFDNVPQFGTNLRTNVGMDFEPEYIAIEQDGSRAFVTLQEANAVAVLDLSLNAFTEIIGLGAKDFSIPGNEFDPKDNDGKVEFITANASGLYMPDGVASYQMARPDLSRARQRRGLPGGQRRSFCGRERALLCGRSPGPPAHFERGFFAGQSVCGGRPLHVDSRGGRHGGVRQRQHPGYRGPRPRRLRRRPQPRQGCGAGGRRAAGYSRTHVCLRRPRAGDEQPRSPSSTSPIPTMPGFST